MPRKASNKTNKKWGSIFRLNISYLSVAQYGTFPILGKASKRGENLSPKLEVLKGHVLELILKKDGHKNLLNYSIAWQTHQSNGLAHLDILLRYDKPVQKRPTSFNYLLDLCNQDVEHFSDKQGKVPQLNITPYSASRINLAILEYGEKEDPAPLSNFTYENSTRYLLLAAVKNNPYAYFEALARKDPYNFDLASYAAEYNLATEIPGYSAMKSKLNDIQAALRALSEKKKPGIKHISRELIEQSLTPDQLATFDKYPCFQTIIDHINQIPKYGYNRPHKTLNLFIWGPRGIGKTSFLDEGSTNLTKFIPRYDIKLQNKYLNRYHNQSYSLITWNEFKYTDFSPTWVLQLLEGADVQIPIRYNSNIKRDNPLVIATSNLSLREHIRLRFKDDSHLRDIAYSNLIGERITEVEVPIPMFFMQKLIHPA